MMSNEILFILVVVISICGAVITILDLIQTIFTIFKSRNRDKETADSIKSKEDIDPKLIEILLKEDSIESIDKILDKCIKDAGDIYNIMILSPNQLLNNSSYITEAEQKQMSEYIYQSIMKTRMNETLKKIISFSYNIDTEEKLENLVRLRIKLYMLTFINEYNSLIDK